MLHAVESERDARDVAEHRAAEERQKPAQAKPKISLEELFARSDDDGPKELRIVLKADVHGSAEAVRDALLKLATDTVKVNVILSGVGAISEGDVMLAKASDAIVVGFHVRPDPAARRAAEGQGVDLRSYQIIYELTDEVRAAMAGLLPPKIEEKVLGRVEVRKTFNVPRIGTIAGCYVLDGMVRRNAKARLIRDGVQIWEGGFASLKRFKDDVREVQTGFECGIGLDGYNDVKVGDIIEPYELAGDAGHADDRRGRRGRAPRPRFPVAQAEARRGAIDRAAAAQSLQRRGRGDRRAGHLAARRARDHHDRQRSNPACAAVSTRVLVFIEELHLAEVTNSDIELLELCYDDRDDGRRGRCRRRSRRAGDGGVSEVAPDRTRGRGAARARSPACCARRSPIRASRS